MDTKIHAHPSVLEHHDLFDICKPLSHFGITYFCHVNIKENQFSALTNNPAFHCFYLEKNYHMTDLHMAISFFKEGYYIWDHFEPLGKSREMHEGAAHFGVKHTFTIHKKNQSGDHLYHFATQFDDKNINHQYLKNLDMLHLFVNYFNRTIGQSKKLNQAYQVKFDIKKNESHFDFSSIFLSEADRHRFSFMKDMMQDKKISISDQAHLTRQQFFILYWLHHGKTIYDVAKLLKVSEITVHKHIFKIKEKLNCYTQFQLGELFSNIPDIEMCFRLMNE